MANYAPLRELCVRVFGTRALFEQYIPKAPVSAGILGPLLQGPEDKRMNAAYRELDALVRREFATAAEHALVQARRLAQVLRGAVPHPAHEQAVVVKHLLELRAAISNGGSLPPLDATMAVASHLWALADARREPMRFVLDATPRSKAGRKPFGQVAIDGAAMAEAMMAIQEGRVTSTREAAELIGTSQTSVSRHPILKAAFRQARRSPKARGFRKKGGEIEAVDSGDNDSEIDSA